MASSKVIVPFTFILMCSVAYGMFGGGGFGTGGMPVPGGLGVRQCVNVKSEHCDKYGFNSTTYPNYLGQVSVTMADMELGLVFKHIKFCTIQRNLAEMIGCAMYVPLCVNGKRFPPCTEDCKEVITTCKVNQIPGKEIALTLCGIFPPRSSGSCISMVDGP